MANKEELIIRKLHNLLTDNQLTISTAESCTGGLISSKLTQSSGSSSYYYGSIIAYHNNIKKNLLKVPSTTLENFGAVSKETVVEMAINAAKIMQTDLSISISGIAGPNGGSEEKPVGSIWLGFYIKGNIYTKLLQLDGSREENRLNSCLLALEELILYTEKDLIFGDNLL